MSTLTWGPALQLAQPQMDATHEEFVTLLARAEAAAGQPDAAPLLAEWEALVAHTTEHFAMEDQWMAASGFAAENCHTFQHQAVLGVMVECAKRAREQGDFEPLRIAVEELATWFPQHAQSMDAALAQHLSAAGFDPATGRCAELAGADAAPLTGCGGSSCG